MRPSQSASLWATVIGSQDARQTNQSERGAPAGVRGSAGAFGGKGESPKPEARACLAAEPAQKKTELPPGMKGSFPQELNSGAVPNARIFSGILRHTNHEMPFLAQAAAALVTCPTTAAHSQAGSPRCHPIPQAEIPRDPRDGRIKQGKARWATQGGDREGTSRPQLQTLHLQSTPFCLNLGRRPA